MAKTKLGSCSRKCSGKKRTAFNKCRRKCMKRGKKR